MFRLRVAVLVLGGLVRLTGTAVAQTDPTRSPSQVFTLDRALQYAVEHYPTVRAALEEVTASTAGVAMARADYLPRLDSLWQSNRATANNIFGQVFPQSVIPAVSGPVLSSASTQSVWGSATGALLSWEPLDFGLRRARLTQAEAAVTQARAGEALTRLDVQARSARRFSVSSASSVRSPPHKPTWSGAMSSRAVHALVDNQLRPGAEAARADAERAAALTRLIQTQQTLTLTQITMARVLGVTTGSVTIDPATLLDHDAIARVEVWRAILGDAVAHGDLT